MRHWILQSGHRTWHLHLQRRVYRTEWGQLHGVRHWILQGGHRTCQLPLQRRVYRTECRPVYGMRRWKIQSGDRLGCLHSLSGPYLLAKCQRSPYGLSVQGRVLWPLHRRGALHGHALLSGRSDLQLVAWLYLHTVKRPNFWYNLLQVFGRCKLSMGYQFA